jgi:hypothetical protein
MECREADFLGAKAIPRMYYVTDLERLPLDQVDVAHFASNAGTSAIAHHGVHFVWPGRSNARSVAFRRAEISRCRLCIGWPPVRYRLAGSGQSHRIATQPHLEASTMRRSELAELADEQARPSCGEYALV